jgi:pantoate--beta-alanine ligase
MEIFKEIAPLRSFLDEAKKAGKSVGLVPTMGALHKGHISLVNASKSANTLTVASIYVNPAQFNSAQDLSRYPKSIENDLEMLRAAGNDAVFCPEDPEMYPEPNKIRISFGDLDQVMEGAFRPDHFSGVALVVAKLFNIISPDNAYFGQKDWQQFVIISRLVHELKFSFGIHSVPIVREADGLAMSSRNQRLTPPQRTNAAVLCEALKMAKNSLMRGEHLQAVKMAVRELFIQRPEMELQYFELADRKNLTLLNRVEIDIPAIICIAAFAGEVRLIDNMFLD